MSFAKKHSTATKLFDFNTPESFKYLNLAELANAYGLEQVHKVNALYINTKGRYGDSPVIATDYELVNAPQHLLDTVKEVLADGESISMINRGNVGFKLYTYANTHGTQYGVEWVDL